MMEGKLMYSETDFATTAGTIDNATSKLNLVRDLSAVNRKGMHMTSAKGVPLVYHCRLTVIKPFGTDRPNSILNALVYTAQHNYVTKNAAVQLHAAREQMFKNAGIKKSDRGRYDSTIRYGWDSAGDTYNLPVLADADGVFTASDVGEWDESIISIKDDADLVPVLFGSELREDVAVNGDTFNLANAYLNSRRKLDVDDLDAGDGAADHSIVRSMFNVEDTNDATIQTTADDNQDQPPYDQDGVRGTFTSKSTSAPASVGNFGAVKDVIDFDAPFGLAEISWTKQADASGNLSQDVIFWVEVLGISEMQ